MFLLFFKSSAPQQHDITQIEFATSTRGYHKDVVIVQYTLKVVELTRNDEHEKITNKKIDSGTWKKLLASLKNISLPEISSLAAPSMKRAVDAARTSTITITTNKGESYAHTFDDEDPNERLRPLMTLIHSLESEDNR